MKLQKSDIVYIIISVVLIVFAIGTYMLYGRMSTVEISPAASETAETATVNSNVEIANQAVKTFEDQLSDATLASAEDATNQVTDETEKASLTERIEDARAKMQAITSAEEALSNFDATGYYETAEEARQAIVALEASDQRTSLVERFNTIASELGLETIATE